MTTPTPADRLSRLTPHQRRVIERLALGDTPTEAAASLGITACAVYTAMRDGRKRTGARTTEQLVAWAVACKSVVV